MPVRNGRMYEEYEVTQVAGEILERKYWQGHESSTRGAYQRKTMAMMKEEVERSGFRLTWIMVRCICTFRHTSR